MNLGWNERGVKWTWDEMNVGWNECGVKWTWGELIWGEMNVGWNDTKPQFEKLLMTTMDRNYYKSMQL